jgi:hypothetical protein
MGGIGQNILREVSESGYEFDETPIKEILENKEQKLTNRLEGYYWCKINEDWEVCFYNAGKKAFERTMDDSYTYEEEFDEIDERRIKR